MGKPTPFCWVVPRTPVRTLSRDPLIGYYCLEKHLVDGRVKRVTVLLVLLFPSLLGSGSFYVCVVT